MRWKKITVETTTQATDMLSYVLNEYGVEGIEVEDKIPLSEEDKKAMFIDILPELPPDDGIAHVSCYVDESMDVKALCRFIEEQLEEMSGYMETGSGRISLGQTEDKDWMNNWKEFFHPLRLEENIVIQPTWTEAAEVRPDDIVIQIDPGTAFGTGSHETTRLCIAKLREYIRPSENVAVLDAGCGSGILSVAAIKLGAGYVCGVDIDELAVKASRENLALNQVAEKQYRIIQGDVIGDKEFAAKVVSGGKYDIVVANILADVIIPLSEVVRPFLKENGVFIASGIIDTKEQAVREAFTANGFEIADVIRMGEWAAVVGK